MNKAENTFFTDVKTLRERARQQAPRAAAWLGRLPGRALAGRGDRGEHAAEYSEQA